MWVPELAGDPEEPDVATGAANMGLEVREEGEDKDEEAFPRSITFVTT